MCFPFFIVVCFTPQPVPSRMEWGEVKKLENEEEEEERSASR
jgi:hypothetical protein